MSQSLNHDIIVVGASAGGVEALSKLVRGLPADLPATVFVVLHVAPFSASALPQILTRHGALKAVHASDGQAIRPGAIYIAPPDFHLVLDGLRMHLVRGPRENGFRPAIDPLFRSAARAFGPRVIGVILSGALGDGAVGLTAIKSVGGVAVVQEPTDAIYASMPRNAISAVDVDYVLPVSEIAAKLGILVHQPVVEGDIAMSNENEQDSELVRRDMAAEEHGERAGEVSIFTCPECGGVLWEIEDGQVLRFRCHVGHSYSAESMFAEQGETLEMALWTAIRALEERASFQRLLASRMANRGHEAIAHRYENQAKDIEKQADVIRRVVRSEALVAPPILDFEAPLDA